MFAPGCCIIQFHCSSITSRNMGPLGNPGRICFIIVSPSAMGFSSHIPINPICCRAAANVSKRSMIPCRRSSCVSCKMSPSIVYSIPPLVSCSARANSSDMAKKNDARHNGPICSNTFAQDKRNSMACIQTGSSSIVLSMRRPFMVQISRPSRRQASSSLSEVYETLTSLNSIIVADTSIPDSISWVNSSAVLIIRSIDSASRIGRFSSSTKIFITIDRFFELLRFEVLATVATVPSEFCVIRLNSSYIGFRNEAYHNNRRPSSSSINRTSVAP